MSIALARPGVITPPRAAQRPPGPFALNRDSAQADGLLCWLPDAAGDPVESSDYSGRLHPVLWTGAPAAQADDVLGRFRQFVPTGQYGVIAASSDFSFGTGDFTVACWFRADASTGTFQILLGKDVAGSRDWALMYGISGSVLTWFSYPSLSQVDGSTGITFGATYHIAVTRKGGVLGIYLNGVLDASASLADSYGLGNDIYLGRREFGGAEQWLNGALTDVRIYGRSHTAAEIAQLYDPRARWDLYYPLRQRAWAFPTLPAGATPVKQLALAGSIGTAVALPGSSGVGIALPAGVGTSIGIPGSL